MGAVRTGPGDGACTIVAMLSFNAVACRRDGTLLFDGASFTVQRGMKVGLTGANGTGKSSLFAMVLGALEPDAGSVDLQNGVGITHVAQETPGSARSAIDHVLDGDRPLRELEAAVEACGDDGTRRAELLARYEEIDGWSAPARAGALLDGLGFSTGDHGRAVDDFSGGWRMRLNLAQALMSPNELLLLDEPTNHLDLDAVIWLEQWLAARAGTLLLVSHDREFLDAVTTHTLSIENGAVSLEAGDFSAFERLRASRLDSARALHEKTTARRRELESFVARFRAKATKARQAQSRLKMLERLPETAAVREDSPFRFAFREPEALPAPLVALERARVGHGETVILDAVRFAIDSGERIGLLGANGAGKTTLVRSIVGALPLLSGTRVPAAKLRVGHFAQHQVEQLDGASSAYRALLDADPGLDETRARTFLGGFGFSGDRVHQRIGTLSGGERARLALALVVHARPNLLLLDEPTNHLDIDMRAALAEALQGFEGGLVVISHDRTLLRSVVDELHLVARGRLAPFDGDLDDYARWLAKERGAPSAGTRPDEAPAPAPRRAPATVTALDAGRARGRATGPSARGAAANGGDTSDGAANGAADGADARARRQADAAARARLAPLKRAAERAERELERATTSLGAVRERLADPELYTDGRKDELAAALADEARERERVASLEEAALEAMQAVDDAADPPDATRNAS